MQKQLWISLGCVAAVSSFAACSSDETKGNSGAGGSATTASSSSSSTGTSTGGSTTTGAQKQDQHVVILFTSDEHSHTLAFSPERDDYPEATKPGTGALKGGIARRSTLLASLRKEAQDAGKDVILVSAGDNQMGCLTHVAFESDSLDYRSMKTLAYDVTTFGNHEFDFGPEALAASIKTAQAKGGLPPIVATNIHFSTDAGDDALQALYSSDVTDDAPVHPYRVLTLKSGAKIGVIGYVGVDASHVAPNKTPITFSEQGVDPTKADDPTVVLPKLYGDLQPVVDKLRNDEKVDLVIALAHGGIPDSSTLAAVQTSEDYNVCKNVTGLDFIVSGHAHNPDPTPFEVDQAKGGKCLVLNGSSFGQHIGRVEFTIPADSSTPVSWDKTTQTLLPVDETTVPDATIAASLGSEIEAIEGANLTGPSFLEGLLSRVTGKTIKNDPNTAGDLYFYPLATTTFSIPFSHSDVADQDELLYLSSDAMLAESDIWGAATMTKTDVGLESAGVLRAGIAQGKTGAITAADAFDVVPLGSSPVDGTLGYPLVRAYVSPFELRGVLEFSLAQGSLDSDYQLGFSGIQVQYDATRPLATSEADLLNPMKGQVMKISLDTDHSDGFDQFDTVIYDRTGGIQSEAPLAVITSSYIADFASQAGVTLDDVGQNPITVNQAIIHRPDGSEVKQVEAFMGYLYSGLGGTLPVRYNKTSSQAEKRWVCIKGC